MTMSLRPLASVLLLAALSEAADAAAVGGIRAQLYYEETGRLSENIAGTDFAAFNVIIGEGSAEEQANDLLVAVEIVELGDDAPTPLRISVRNERGRILARRTVAGPFYSESGRLWKAVWLQDVGCAGPLTITATLGRSTRTETIRLVCGE